MRKLFERNALDRQLERSRLKPPRHPFRRLAEFVGLLFALGAGLFTVAIAMNPVPTVDQLIPSAAAAVAARLVPASGAAVRPEHWTVRMSSEVVNGRRVDVGTVDDPRVSQMIRSDFLAAYQWLFATGWHADYTATVGTYFSDPPDEMPDAVGMASGVRAFLDASAAKGEFVQIHVLDDSLAKNAQVFGFSSDGLTVHVSTVVEGRSQRWALGPPTRLLEENPIQRGTRLVYTLVYDPAEHRWKIVDSQQLS